MTESELIVCSRHQPAEQEDNPEPFYSFLSNITITSQESATFELRSASIALNIGRINPNNNIFTWNRSTGINPGTRSVTLPYGNLTGVEIMTQLASLMSAADTNANYTFSMPFNSVSRITSVPASVISAVSGSFTRCMLFDMPTHASRLGGTYIDFLYFQDIVLPKIYLVAEDMTKHTTNKSTSAGNMTDHIKALDLIGGHEVIHYSFENPIRLEFWKGQILPRIIRFELRTFPGEPLLKSYYPNNVIPTNCYAVYYLAMTR